MEIRYTAPREAFVIEVVAGSLAVELARNTLPALVVAAGMAGSLWLLGRSRAAGALGLLGGLLVLGSFLVCLVLFPGLTWAQMTGVLEPGSVAIPLLNALVRLVEGVGLVLMVVAAIVGPAPVEEE